MSAYESFDDRQHVCRRERRLLGNLAGHLLGGQGTVIIRLQAIDRFTLAGTDVQFDLSGIEWL